MSKVRVWDGEQMVSPDYVDREGWGWWKANSIPTRNKKLIPFIGITDKNGEDIYEGSILYSSSWWWGAGFVYPLREGNKLSYIMAQDMENPLEQASYNNWYSSEVEIIGSVEETPELIGKFKRSITPVTTGGTK